MSRDVQEAIPEQEKSNPARENLPGQVAHLLVLQDQVRLAESPARARAQLPQRDGVEVQVLR